MEKSGKLHASYRCTYLLTPGCRVLLEKLTGLQLVKKFHAFHGTRRFITALTSVRHLSLSWASPTQSIYPHPISWRSILILSTHLCLGLPNGSFPPVSQPIPYTPPSPHPYAPHVQPISFFSILSPAIPSAKSPWSPQCPSQTNGTFIHTHVLILYKIYISADLLFPPHIHTADSKKIKYLEYTTRLTSKSEVKR